MFAQHTGSINDTICLPTSDALKVLKGGLDGKVYKEQRDSLIKYIDGLNSLLEIRNTRIANLSNEIANYDQIVSNYKKQIAVLEDQKKLARGFINSLNSHIKKQKRKTTMVAILGILASAGAFYIGTR